MTPRSPQDRSRAGYQPFNPDSSAGAFVDHEARSNGLRISCWDCGHEVEVHGSRLVDQFGAETTLAQLWPRLRCSCCGVGRIHAYYIGMGPSRHPARVRYRPGYGPEDKSGG